MIGTALKTSHMTYVINRIYLYCPEVTEKSTNPSVKLTKSMPRHGQVNLTWGLVDISVTNGQKMLIIEFLIIFLLYVQKKYFSVVNIGKLEESSHTMLPFQHICLWRHSLFTGETGCVFYHPHPCGWRACHSGQIIWITLWIWEEKLSHDMWYTSSIHSCISWACSIIHWRVWENSAYLMNSLL